MKINPKKIYWNIKIIMKILKNNCVVSTCFKKWLCKLTCAEKISLR